MALSFQDTNGSTGSGTLTSSGTYLTTANFTGSGNFEAVVLPSLTNTTGCGSYTDPLIELAVLVLSLDSTVSALIPCDLRHDHSAMHMTAVVWQSLIIVKNKPIVMHVSQWVWIRTSGEVVCTCVCQSCMQKPSYCPNSSGPVGHVTQEKSRSNASIMHSWKTQVICEPAKTCSHCLQYVATFASHDFCVHANRVRSRTSLSIRTMDQPRSLCMRQMPSQAMFTHPPSRHTPASTCQTPTPQLSCLATQLQSTSMTLLSLWQQPSMKQPLSTM